MFNIWKLKVVCLNWKFWNFGIWIDCEIPKHLGLDFETLIPIRSRWKSSLVVVFLVVDRARTAKLQIILSFFFPTCICLEKLELMIRYLLQMPLHNENGVIGNPRMFPWGWVWMNLGIELVFGLPLGIWSEYHYQHYCWTWKLQVVYTLLFYFKIFVFKHQSVSSAD